MIIIAERIGQLGNRLTLFSHFIGFAQDHGLQIANLAFDDYAPLFPATRRDLYCRYPPARSWLPPLPKFRGWLFRLAAKAAFELAGKLLPFVHVCRLTDTETCALDADFAALARRKVVFVCGWQFRKPGGLKENAPALRDYFRPSEASRQAIQQTVQAARQGADLLLGVHLRQGDYRDYNGGRYFFTSAQYAACLAQAAALFAPQKVAFLLCSNEHQDAALFAGLSVTVAQGSALEDMYALAECDYLLGPPSTFTWWASFYGNVPLCQLHSADVVLTHEDFHIYSG